MKKITSKDLNENFFHLLNNEWALVSAGNETSSNMMTASWGGFGILWNKEVATIYIRPQRFTYHMIEENDTFSLSFLDQSHHQAMSYCGTHSGRDEDKYERSGLHKMMLDTTPCIEEARLVFICKKLYFHDIDEKHFINQQDVLDNYPKQDYHRSYIAEILAIYTKETLD
ncbi:MAG: flavin reductase family protein [Erysipelotrichaceae bacterium]